MKLSKIIIEQATVVVEFDYNFASCHALSKCSTFSKNIDFVLPKCHSLY